MADIGYILAWIIIGGLAGWLASVLVSGGGLGLIGDVLIGIIGAVIGGWFFGGTQSSVGTFVIAFIGAAILLAIFKLIRRI